MEVNNCIKVLSAILIVFGYSNDGYSTEQNGNIQSNSSNRLQRARHINEQIMKQINNEWLEDRLNKTLEAKNISYSDPEWKRMEVIKYTFDQYKNQIIQLINQIKSKSLRWMCKENKDFINFLNTFSVPSSAHEFANTTIWKLYYHCEEYVKCVGKKPPKQSPEELLQNIKNLQAEMQHQITNLFTDDETGIKSF